jgi:hypothetical protein
MQVSYMSVFGLFRRRKKKHRIVPRTVQQSIPYTAVFADGTIETLPGTYTRAYRLEDVSFKIAPDEEQDLRAIEKLTRVRIPEGDKSVFDRLPPPQKETLESEFRNARGRMPRDKGRRENSGNAQGKKQGVEKKVQNPQKPQKFQNAQKPVAKQTPDAKNIPQPAKPGDLQPAPFKKKHRRNRPGSRARRRMRASGDAG